MTRPPVGRRTRAWRAAIRIWLPLIFAIAFTVLLGVAPLVSLAALPSDEALCGFVVKHPGELCVRHTSKGTTTRDIEEQRAWNLRGGVLMTVTGSVLVGVMVFVRRAVASAARGQPENPIPPG